MIVALALAALTEMRFEIRTKPFVDLHFYVRSLAESKDPPPDVPGIPEAVAVVRGIEAEFGGTIAWALLEGLFHDCGTAEDATAALASAQETVGLRGGKELRLRETGTKLVAALGKAEPAFLEKVWPAHAESIEEGTNRIWRGFAGQEDACLRYVAKHLGLRTVDRPIRVRLVHEGPTPGAVTHRVQGGTTCFVAVEAFDGTQLLEAVLHEATHALDNASASPHLEDDVLDLLRARMKTSGFTIEDREWRDVPHTLMFVQAGETIRRVLDPEHRHYGVVAKYYDKVRAIADAELEAWTAYLDGKTTRDEALERIVARVASAKGGR